MEAVSLDPFPQKLPKTQKNIYKNPKNILRSHVKKKKIRTISNSFHWPIGRYLELQSKTSYNYLVQDQQFSQASEVGMNEFIEWKNSEKISLQEEE